MLIYSCLILEVYKITIACHFSKQIGLEYIYIKTWFLEITISQIAGGVFSMNFLYDFHHDINLIQNFSQNDVNLVISENETENFKRIY